MHILIGSPEQESATGNWVTARRYKHGLEQFGHRVTLSYLPENEDRLAPIIEASTPDMLLLIHAYRTGRQWLPLRRKYPLPIAVMLSGTDLNTGLLEADKTAVIEEVMRCADALLCHNRLQIEKLVIRYPHIAGRLHYLPPSIELGNAPYPLRRICAVPEAALLFLCPASVRPVKGLLELMQLFDAVEVECTPWQLLFCGPILDEDYAQRFLRGVQQRSWAHYLGIVEADAMPAAMKQVDVVVNNSSSEGLPNALIEAATLGVPILARDIDGNRPVVDHGVNGLLYSDAAGFCECVDTLLCDENLRHRLTQPRPQLYSLENEARVLNSICSDLVADG